MLCQKCQRQPNCVVYQISQKDRRILQQLKQLKHCEMHRRIKR